MSVRHAALLMHALAEQDRTWLWERLGDQQRAMLKPLLGELSELGLPRDEALVQEVLATHHVPSGKEVREVVSPLDQLDDLPPARVAELLAGEPPAFVSRLMSLKDWKWRVEVARLCGMDAVPTCDGSARGERFVWHAARLLVERWQAGAGTHAVPVAELHADRRPAPSRRKFAWRLSLWGNR